MKIKAQLVGVEVALKTLKRKGDALAEAKVQHQLDLAAEDVKSRIHPPLGPTGNLRRALKTGRTKRRPGSFVAMDFKIAPHHHFVEFGTSRMAARPYFRPGVRAGRRFATQILQEGLSGLISKA